MTTTHATPRRRYAAGFTLAELLVYMVIGLIVLSSAYQLMITQGRAYGKQREVMDVRETARGAMALLAWELRHAASGGSRLVAMNQGSIALRSVQGLGIVCAKHPTLPRYALWRTGGSIEATADDSALIYTVGLDKWRVVKINQVGTPTTMGLPQCAWPGARKPDLVVQVAVTTKQDTSGIAVGAALRAFRRVEYAEFQVGGRWWLGRKVGAAATYDQVTGPLLAPGAGGLTFAYFDTLGAVTTTPTAVGAVGLTLRTESLKQVRVGPGPLQFQRDSLTTTAALRR